MQLPKPYYSTLSRSLLLTAGSLVFMALGAFFIYHADEFRDSGETALVGWACVLFFGACGAVGAYSSIKRRLILTLTTKGIALPKGTLIRWKDIAGFQIIRLHSNKMIAVLFHDPQTWLEEHPRTQWELNDRLVGTPVVLSVSITGVRAKDMVETLEMLRQRYGVCNV